LKNEIKFGTRLVECENIIINHGERQGIGIKDKADKTKVMWTENIIIRPVQSNKRKRASTTL
jgi:hypothetical protein